MKKGIKNIVFDVGMVLIDFCWAAYCKELGYDESTIHEFKEKMIDSPYWAGLDDGSLTTDEAIMKFVEAMPHYEDKIRRFWDGAQYFVREYPYADGLVKELQEKGYKVYLLSNYPLDMYHLHWPTFAFFKRVDGYIVSAEEKIAKPNLAIYRLLCERYNLKEEECFFIDDRQVNVDAAKSVGMDGCLFTGYEELREQMKF